MNTMLRVVSTLVGILFVVTGLRWIVDPAGAAASMDMELLDGLGRSTQIADLGTFFLALGMMVLVGVITLQRRWFHVPVLMLFGAAILRVLAWLLHDATLAGELIALEVVVGCVLLFTASRLGAKQ